MTIKNTSTLLLGMTCLCGCTSTKENVEKLPETAVITETAILNSCDKEEKMYYLEFDTNNQSKGPEYAGVICFGCGAENVHTAQRDFPKGAVVNLQESAPRLSKLVKLGKNGKAQTTIFDKTQQKNLQHSL